MYTKFNKLSVVQQHKLKPAIKWLVWLKREDRKRKQANDPRHLKKEKAKAKRARGKWNGQEIAPTAVSVNWTTSYMLEQ